MCVVAKIDKCSKRYIHLIQAKIGTRINNIYEVLISSNITYYKLVGKCIVIVIAPIELDE